jgi:lysophospholipase L1-like esterase
MAVVGVGLRIIAMSMFLLTGWLGAIPSVSAHSGHVDLASLATADSAPSLTYFALGDSYASGYGLPGDDKTHCDRSPNAYPYLVKAALSQTYTNIDLHHLACMGATAGTNTKDTSDPDKSINHQFATADAILDQRDGTADPDPVLVTITIGANDIGLTDPTTLQQIIRPLSAIQPTVIAPDTVRLGLPQSGLDFFAWLDKQAAPMAPSLTAGIDTLLSHKNVHIVLTDYPNPFRQGGFGACNDFFRSLSCDDAMNFLILRLNSIMLDQLIRVKDPSRLRVAALGSSFASHTADCAPFAASANADVSWFQQPDKDNPAANIGACVHPNQQGAQGIADEIVGLVHTMMPAPVAASPRTWPASVQVALCNVPPNSGQAMHCQAAAGVVVNVSLASGELLGSCTSGAPQQFPGGDMISLCSIDGLPFNADLVASQDLSTIPPGYEPFSNSLTLHVDDLIPGGGDQATFTFFDVPIDPSGSTGTTPGSVIENFIVGCVPAEACYNAMITLSRPDGELITRFTCVPPTEPVSSWLCRVPNVPRGITVVITIDNIPPGYAVEQNPLYWDTIIERTAGPVGNRPIFRFDEIGESASSAPSTANESATILMTFRACPDGFDPATGDFAADCTIPLDAPDAAIIVWGGDGQGGMNITGLDRQYDGTYSYTAGSQTMNLQLSGLAPVVRNAYQVVGADAVNGETYTVNLADGETRQVFIYYYNE